MTFWTDTQNFQPNLKNKFKVLISFSATTSTTDYVTFLAKSVDPLPSFDTELIGGELNQDGSGYDPYNKQARVKWKPITISFVDIAYPEYESNLIYKFMQLFFEAGYHPPNRSGQGIRQTDPTSILVDNASLSQYLGAVEIHTLRPDGTLTSKYELMDPVITGMSIANLAYDSNDLHDFSLTFNYSYAKYTAAYCD